MQIQVFEGGLEMKEEVSIGTFDLNHFLEVNADALEGEKEQLRAALEKGEEYRILGFVGCWHTVRRAS